MTTEYTHMLFSLLGVLALMFVCFYFLKKFRHASQAGNKQIKILNAVSVGTKERIMLVEVNNTTLLIGATPNHIETLYVFNTEALPAGNRTFSEQVESLAAEAVN